MNRVLSLFLCGGLVGPLAFADTASLSTTADTYIVSSSQGNNAGAWSFLTVGADLLGGAHRSLYQFDLTGIPAGSIVTSAVFAETVIKVPPSGAANSGFEVYRLLADWTEGSQSGNNGLGSGAATGEATWNDRHFGLESWTNPGGDFDAPLLATVPVSGTGPYLWTGSNLLAAVQGWVDDPNTNFGLIMRSDAEGAAGTFRQVGSREGGNAATLDVGFVPPPPPAIPGIVNFTINPANLTLIWTNDPSLKYDVMFTRRLTGTQDWRLAEANIKAHPLGTNVWIDPPYLAGPLYPTNNALWYHVQGLAASPSGIPVRLQVVVSNLVSPVVLTHAGDGSDRIFFCEQLGQIRILDASRTLVAAPFLDISAKMTNLAPPFGITPGINPGYDERGLLGLAFHPNYATNGRFFIYYSSPKTGPGINCESIVAEYHVSATNANNADPASESILLRFDKPEFNHNGGSLEFGPDGYLYISTGDGGGAGDAHPPYGNGQNISNLLGKILRIDVDGAPPYVIPPDNPLVGVPGARPEIFAHGFRNPWKASFDGTNIWVADVGQDVWEEVDLVRKGGNYGWRILEGNHAYDPSVANIVGVHVPNLDFPIAEYKHGPLGISIIGGFVYRGTNYPAMQGKYVFGDFSVSFGVPDGAVYYLEETRSTIWERFDFALAPSGGRLNRFVKGFGSDENGEVYLLSTTSLGPSGLTGDIRQLVPP